MNRRRFLSMLGVLPAAIALRWEPTPVTKGTPLRIAVRSPMNDFRTDLQYAEILSRETGGIVPGPQGSAQLINANGGEMVLPRPKPRTLAERAEARELAEAVIRVESAYLALAHSPIGIELLAAEDALEALIKGSAKTADMTKGG